VNTKRAELLAFALRSHLLGGCGLDDMRNRAKEHFPAVLLTFLSIIQALALEFWWSSMRESPFLWNGGWAAWVGWAQYIALLLGILEIWLVYTGMVMRFVWVPGFHDSVLPFLIGIIEFSLVDLMGPDTLPYWLYMLALIFLVMVGSSHLAFIQARREPENARHFEMVSRATGRDFVSESLSISAIIAMGVGLQVTGNREGLAFACMVVCACFLAVQINTSRRFWSESMGGEDEGSSR
jgi:hypothetical protein